MTRVIRSDPRGARVVPGVLVDANEQANALIEQARSRAGEMLQQARVQAAELLAAASQRGEELGRATGRDELAAALADLAVERDRMLSALEQQAVQIAIAAAQHVIGLELALRPETVHEIVAPLLNRLRRARATTLHVHPDDAAALQIGLDRLRERVKLGGSLRLESDPTISRGGCVVQSDIGSLDARLQTRLEVMVRALGASESCR